MDECFHKWDNDEKSIRGSHESLVVHESMIKRMKEKIRLACSKVFVSYSHRDTEWLERLQVHMKPLQREGVVELWDDTRIKTSQDWYEEINKALMSSKVAILLVSADFLASDFISTEELPRLLANAQDSIGVAIMPLIVSPCRFIETKSISRFQPVNPPSNPLIAMAKAEQEEVFVKITKEIEQVIYTSKLPI
jgi:hypothetical protein